MRTLRILAYVIAAVFGAYILSFGVLYFAGYRVYRFPTSSMVPVVQKGERVIGRLSENYGTNAKRFSIVIYRNRQAPGQLYAKRIVGLPGEHITIDEKGVMIDGRLLSLPSTIDVAGFAVKKCDLTIPADAVFLLGDNTTKSADSRYFGPIPKADILGYLVFKK